MRFRSWCFGVRGPVKTRQHLTAKSTAESGQVGVVVLLVMAVVLTVGLSTAVNSTQDVDLSRQEAESTRVFNAAEAGIEQALSTYDTGDTSGTVNSISGVDVAYTVSEVNSVDTRLFEGVSISVDVTGNNGNDLRIQWSREDSCATENPASLLVSIFSDDGTGPTVRYEALAGCDRGGSFTSVSSINTDGFRREYDLPLTSDDQFVRIKPLYNDTHLRVVGDGWTLPVQGVRVRSDATNQQGNEVRSVEVNRSLPTAPSVMDYGLVSGTTIVK